MPSEEVGARPRVLIVDDEESVRLLLAHILSESLNVEVQLAGTAEQALRLAENQAYDAVLLDLLMPGIGGYGVLSAIRRSSPNANTPVIVVSQVTERDAIDRCIAAGANAYHTKPIKRAELVATVKTQLAARKKAKAK
jgi:CheY-like chemotaxis protein